MNKNKVVFVDDEVSILNAIKRCIIDEPIEPFFATSGEKAIQFIGEHSVSVIITDMRMPNMNGLDLLKKVKEISPSTVRIVLSGYTQLPQILATVNSVGVFRYITKPWDDDEDFLPSLRDAVNYYNTMNDSQLLCGKLDSKNKQYEQLVELNEVNKKLITQMSSSISNIKKVSNIIQKVQNTYVENFKSNYNELCNALIYSKSMGDLYFNYLDSYITDKERFSFGKYREDLISVLNIQMKVATDDPNYNLLGDYKLIKFVTVESIKYLINNFGLSSFEINILSKPKFIVVIKNSNFDFYNNFNSNLKMKLFFSVIDQIMTTIDGRVNFSADSVNQMILLFDAKA